MDRLASFPERVLALRDGAQVAVRERGAAGAGASLVLLHGISSGAASWAQALPATGHVLAWDAPGYGASTPLAQDAPLAADYAARLHETLLALGVQRCVLVGHSLGALMACAYAARADKVQVERLVLISPARGYGDDAAAAERVRRERGEALKNKGVAGIAAAIDQRLLSPQAGAQARELVRASAARLNPQGYLQAVQMLAGSTLAKVPQDIPVEVHCGEADVVTPLAQCEQVARALGATFSTIANAGHASPAERPEAVAALIGKANG
ncbi:alpha/beta fold hydrolase [Ramlibacter sp. XY19]|uniref:alpha/beta fold hydrolase n=1 Tax=Ramlibacter paludis TaxID=2908000 RepID=UPI0023D9F397|nr:alpha/beta fold hydrolase [Ramlibacter paludis]MCG2594282.1 alpha/beta fold hydrolase [Ramlibacter paludis]